MTFAEMHDELDFQLDKFQAPSFDAVEKDRVLNEAADEWLRENHKFFEQTQKIRDELGGLVVQTDPLPSATYLQLNTLSEYRHLLSVLGLFEYQCNTSVTERWVEIVPQAHDKFGSTIGSPFQVPDDRFPLYIERRSEAQGRILDFYSLNPPKSFVATYLRELPRIDGASDPNNTLDGIVPNFSQRTIIEIAVRSSAGIIADQQRYQQEVQVEQPRKQ